jgi:hypothetical protein
MNSILYIYYFSDRYFDILVVVRVHNLVVGRERKEVIDFARRAGEILGEHKQGNSNTASIATCRAMSRIRCVAGLKVGPD